MQTLDHTHAKDLAIQKTTSKQQLCNFFKHYPIEYAQENIAHLFERIIPDPLETDEITSKSLFYEELKLMLKNCELLYADKVQNANQHHLLATYANVNAVVNFLKEVVPVSYIFSNTASANRTDLIIVMDQHKYKPLNEVLTLLDFVAAGYSNINCTVYTYGTINEYLLNGHVYFSALCIPENCIYQSTPYFTLPVLDQGKRTALIDKSTLLFNQNIQKAITFYNGACKISNEKESTIPAFMLQQACELSYRSLLISLRGKQVKCHDLVVLRKHVSHFASSIIGVVDEDEKHELAILTAIQESYVKSRYDQMYSISGSELKQFFATAEKLIKAAKDIFNWQCKRILTTYRTTF